MTKTVQQFKQCELKMFKLVFLTFSAFIVTVHSQRCVESSFSTISVRLYNNATENIVDKNVARCISPNTIPNYNENTFLGIKVMQQSIPNLNKGIVAGFRGPFTINFEDNKIETIKTEAFFNLPGVRSISLLSSGIKWIETGAFSNLPSLLYVNLEKNNITSLSPNVFDNLPKLERLVLSNNQLNIFKPDSLRDVPNLQVLDLDYNNILQIRGDSFSTLPSLRNLNLYGNQIQTLDIYAFRSLKNLLVLNLGNNLIKNLNFNFVYIPNLAVLELQGNFINYISRKLLQDLSSMKTFTIHSNPLQCSCLDQLSQWGHDNRVALFTQCNTDVPVCVDAIRNPSECIPRHDSDFPSNMPNFKSFLKVCA
ncbi:hypothetical protein RI129_009736 [Pyrocoelia pectoralis]|uniref:Uncharacterized protein n=1 Tax=Pyrocoelia pectoralis TaxID=417401 RepID=A0AAN7VC61_9COLE